MPPKQKPGRSEQTVVTPDDFRNAVIRRFGWPDFDLAASEDNYFSTMFESFYSEEDDALRKVWDGSLMWLNPPFGLLEQFSAKCREYVEQGGRGTILMLAPLGTQDWYLKNCKDYSVRLELTPRLTFEGHKQSYPKDLALYVFHCGLTGSQVWNWKSEE